jgi:3',5'-cyclic-AMP phosphodiesterase
MPPLILHVTDTHLFASPERVLRGVVTRATLERVLAQVAEHPRRPDAILLTGDLVHDESHAGYAWLRERFSAFGVPVCCIAGNHDDPAVMREILDAPPFQCAGDAAFGRWRIVLLETHVPGADHGLLSDETLARLDATLARDAGSHALVCLHHHPVAVGSAWLDPLGVVNGNALFAVLARHANVRALLSGHIHQAFDATAHGLRVLATPSTCVQFEPGSATFRQDTLPPACRWLTLHDDGRVDTEIAWAAT